MKSKITSLGVRVREFYGESSTEILLARNFFRELSVSKSFLDYIGCCELCNTLNT